MYLLSENTKETFEFPNKSYVMVGSSDACDIRITTDGIADKHFAIIREQFGLVLEIFDHPLRVNDQECREMRLLNAGDHINIGDDHWVIIDENKVPREARRFKHNPNINSNSAMTSVYGLRAYSGAQNGEFIIPNQRIALENFVLINKKNLERDDPDAMLRLNGHEITCSRIANGDVISSSDFKYIVEFPGSSGFSKFSPSHPRNVLLSEKLDAKPVSKTAAASDKGHFWKNNGWWIAMVSGLVVISLVLILSR